MEIQNNKETVNEKNKIEILSNEFDKSTGNSLILSEKACKKCQKVIISQSKLIYDLINRVKNLEIYSDKRNQEIGKLQRDFYHAFKSYDKDYESAMWMDEDLNLEDENIVNDNNNNDTKSDSSSFSQENIFKLDQIHNKIQKIITRRENLGNNIKKNHFRK